MARPTKERYVCSMPKHGRFGPLGQKHGRQKIVMGVDEYETIRLIDQEQLTQEECAEQMNIARTTVQGIYTEARKKLAAMLVEGKTILIEGGRFSLCEEHRSCGKTCMRAKKECHETDNTD